MQLEASVGTFGTTFFPLLDYVSISLLPFFLTCSLHPFSSSRCSGLSLHIFSCNPLTHLSRCLPPHPHLSSLSPSLRSSWLRDSCRCLLSAGLPSEERPCRGRAVRGRSRRGGEPERCDVFSDIVLFCFCCENIRLHSRSELARMRRSGITSQAKAAANG